MINIEELDLIVGKEVCEILGVKTRNQICYLTKKFKIPHKKTHVGNIYLREDIVKFQNSPERQKGLKYRRNK